VDDKKDWAAIFDQEFSKPVSTVGIRVWRDVFGSEYPDGLDSLSMVSRTELSMFCDAVERAGAGQLVDIGCGRGGPGVWVAAETGANLTGVDISPRAVEEAKARADALGLAGRTRFVVGSFADLPLATDEADAIMSVDALLFAPDKQAAIAELGRVARPGGVLVFTSWDYRRQPAGRPPQVPDHRPLLEAAGFVTQHYAETAEWRDREERMIRGLLAAVDEMAGETGDDAVEVRAALEEMAASIDDMIRRVLVIAERG
jgi:SAM-dependent methyltransferase